MSAADDYTARAREAAHRFAENVKRAAGRHCDGCGASSVNGIVTLDGKTYWLCWTCSMGALAIRIDRNERRQP